MPGTQTHSKDPGKNIKRLAHDDPGMPPKQRVAVGIAEAHRKGAKIPRPKRKAK
jgi:hypothetical protein